jgi:hypothetical protein
VHQLPLLVDAPSLRSQQVGWAVASTLLSNGTVSDRSELALTPKPAKTLLTDSLNADRPFTRLQLAHHGIGLETQDYGF